jgi:hypothetical protein
LTALFELLDQLPLFHHIQNLPAARFEQSQVVPLSEAGIVLGKRRFR